MLVVGLVDGLGLIVGIILEHSNIPLKQTHSICLSGYVHVIPKLKLHDPFGMTSAGQANDSGDVGFKLVVGGVGDDVELVVDGEPDDVVGFKLVVGGVGDDVGLVLILQSTSNHSLDDGLDSVSVGKCRHKTRVTME
jgi:hypothetical protein